MSVNTSLILFAKMDASAAAVSRGLVDGVVISAELFILTRFRHAKRYPFRSKTL